MDFEWCKNYVRSKVSKVRGFHMLPNYIFDIVNQRSCNRGLFFILKISNRFQQFLMGSSIKKYLNLWSACHFDLLSVQSNKINIKRICSENEHKTLRNAYVWSANGKRVSIYKTVYLCVHFMRAMSTCEREKEIKKPEWFFSCQMGKMWIQISLKFINFDVVH